MKRRHFLQLMGASAAAVCSPGLLAADSKTKFTVYGPPVMPTVLLGVAAQRGELKNSRPFDVKVWRNVDALRAGLANGTMQASVVPSYVAANLAARGQDVKLVNIMSFGLLYVLGRDRALSGIGDLAGKTLALPFKNDMPDLVLQALCRRLKIDFSRIRVQYAATPPEAMMMFMQKRADFALLPEPMVSMGIIRGRQMGQNVVRALDMQQEWEKVMKVSGGIPQAGLMVSGAFLKQNADAVRRLQADLLQAAAWSKANAAQAAAIGAKHLGLPEQALAAGLPHARLAATPAKEAAAGIKLFFRELYQLNPAIVGGKLPADSLFV